MTTGAAACSAINPFGGVRRGARFPVYLSFGDRSFGLRGPQLFGG